jgi:phytoene desaturase (3,4-didehydrolycopene-forming)
VKNRFRNVPFKRNLHRYSADERLRALFSYQELYVGLSPYNAPGRAKP